MMGLGVDDLLEGAATAGILAGIGIAAAAPLLLLGTSKPSRPIAKALLHGYLDLADKAKEVGGEAVEKWQDLLAEVKTEREARSAAPPRPPVKRQRKASPTSH
jgi:hypothetical protein